jgi:hypothetical protein
VEVGVTWGEDAEFALYDTAGERDCCCARTRTVACARAAAAAISAGVRGCVVSIPPRMLGIIFVTGEIALGSMTKSAGVTEKGS